MKLYKRDTPLRGFADDLLHYHVWSVGRKQHHCYHYELDDPERIEKALRMGAKKMTDSGWCTKEIRI